jgi:uncharacterized membrane protein
MGLTLAGVFFHLLFLTSLNLHFYLEFYRYTYTASLVFFCINGGGAFLLAVLDLHTFAGANYLLAAVIASLFSLTVLLREGKKVDRYILAGVKTM